MKKNSLIKKSHLYNLKINFTIIYVSFLFISHLFTLNYLYAQDSLQCIATITGNRDKDNFGGFISGVGDINKDGFDDFAIGAPGGNYVNLYFGGSPFDTAPDLKFVCNRKWAEFGRAIAGGRDINGDDYPDLIIGAPGYGDFTEGKVFIYFGGSQMDNIPDLTITCWGPYYNFGCSAAMAGDVNNDGYCDIIIGSPNDYYYDGRGRFYIFYGGAEMDTIADVHIEGFGLYDALGESVAGVGDINKDGYDDVLVGMPESFEVSKPGKAFLFYGGDEMGFSNSETILGDTTMDYGSFGRIVTGLGDVDNDGYNDFGVLSRYLLKIISGKLLSQILIINTKTTGPVFDDLEGVGDINNDGYDDFFVGISMQENEYVGELNVYYGQDQMDTIPDMKIEGEITFGGFATRISYIGDFNKDSKRDILLTQSLSNSIRSVHIYTYNSATGINNKNVTKVPRKSFLYPNYPNPFNSTTIIPYYISHLSKVTMEIYDLKGSKIKTLVSEFHQTGAYSIQWNGRDNNNFKVSSGIYFVKIAVKNDNDIYTDVQKITLLN